MDSYQKELAQIKTILKNNRKGMTVTDIAKEMNINRNSVAKYLDILLISGHAEMVTFGPAKVFFPSRRVPLSSLLNFTLDYIALLDKNLRFLQVNDNLAALLTTPRSDLIGSDIDSVSFPLFQLPEVIQNTKNALDGKESTNEIHYPIHNAERFLQIKHIPTAFDDGEPGVTLIIEDITERKTAEQKMKQAIQQWETTFNSINDMISIQDRTFTIQRVNQSYASFFHRKPEDCIGKKCYELIHGTKGMHASCPCIQVDITKKPSTVEFFEPHLEKYLEISASPIFTDDGDISGSVHIIKDITDRKMKKE